MTARPALQTPADALSHRGPRPCRQETARKGPAAKTPLERQPCPSPSPLNSTVSAYLFSSFSCIAFPSPLYFLLSLCLLSPSPSPSFLLSSSPFLEHPPLLPLLGGGGKRLRGQGETCGVRHCQRTAALRQTRRGPRAGQTRDLSESRGPRAEGTNRLYREVGEGANGRRRSEDPASRQRCSITLCHLHRNTCHPTGLSAALLEDFPSLPA